VAYVKAQGSEGTFGHFGSEMLRGRSMEFQSELVGRDKNMETLLGLLDQALASKGSLVFITGEAGIGKTRLVQELIDKAGKKGVQCLSGKCLYQEGADPYLPFVEPLKRFLAGSEEDDDVQYRIPMGLSVMGLENGGRSKTREALPMGLIGMDSDEDASTEPDTDAQRRKSLTDIDFTKERDKMFSTVSYLLRDLSMDRPIMFFLDDLHWADSSTLQLLTYIARNIRDVKVLMVCAYRTEELEMGGRRHPLREALQIMSRERLFTELRLTRLVAEDTKKMITFLLKGSPLPDGFVERIFKETEGNPYFIEEVIKSMVTEGLLNTADPHWYIRFDLAGVKIPSTVNDLVMRRIDNLDQDTKKILEMASVIGEEFTLDLLTSVTNIPEEDLVDKLDSLIENKLLAEVTGTGADKYRFTHKLIREVTYAGLSRAKGRLLHKKVGECIENMPDKALDKEVYGLAYHFSQGNVVDKAVNYTIMAGDKASSSFAPEDAINYFNRALEFLEKLPPSKENDERRVTILTKIGDHHHLIGEWDRAVDYYYLMERRAKKMDNMKMVGLANRKMGQIERLRGNWDNGEHHYTISLEIARKYGDDVGRADSERGLGYIHWRRGQFDDAIKHFEDSLEISKGIGDRFVTGRTYIELGNVLAERGILEGAEFHYNTAIEILEQIHDYQELARAYNNLGDVYMKKEDWEKAIEHLEQAVELSKKLGDPHMCAWAHFNLAECYSKSNRLEKALENLESSKSLLEESDDAVGRSYLHIEYGVYYRYKHDWEQAQKSFEDGLRVVDELGIPAVAAYAYTELAMMYKDKGETAKAIEYLNKAKGIYEVLQAPIYVEKMLEQMRKLQK
jgi:predicted ATPase